MAASQGARCHRPLPHRIHCVKVTGTDVRSGVFTELRTRQAHHPLCRFDRKPIGRISLTPLQRAPARCEQYCTDRTAWLSLFSRIWRQIWQQEKAHDALSREVFRRHNRDWDSRFHLHLVPHDRGQDEELFSYESAHACDSVNLYRIGQCCVPLAPARDNFAR